MVLIQYHEHRFVRVYDIELPKCFESLDIS